MSSRLRAPATIGGRLRAVFVVSGLARYLDRYFRHGRHEATSAHTVARPVLDGGASRSSWKLRPASAAGWRTPHVGRNPA